jgi:K+-transporting ATPase ATPase A chain
MGAVSPESSFNTAVSFTTNTNWQGYAGESTMSYLTQMAGLAWHNFTSAAAGIGVALVIARGLTRQKGPDGPKTVGNFWVDLNRAILYVLLPISIVFTLVLVSQGVIQNFSAYLDVTTLEGGKQTIALGPVASQEVIKELGTNGGGFFNANSAHPFENPNGITNMIELLLIFVIPAALTYTYGLMARDTKQGWAIFGAMAFLFVGGVFVCYWAEARGNPLMSAMPIAQPLGNMEGKEVRYGVSASALWATVTTDTSCGAVNSMHDSFTALGGLVPLANIQLGELVFGGVGAGLYAALLYVVLAVFIAGLMEVGWAIGLKYTEGFTRLVPSVLTLACMAGSILLLGLALKVLPIGTAYAVWTGIGAVGTAILGIALFGEPATAARLACIGLIVAGIVGLKLVTASA